jgi:hypothetical protein
MNYPFGDEAVTLTTKSYAIRSTITGKCLLRGKGISEWMMKDDDKQKSRSKWNCNDR